MKIQALLAIKMDLKRVYNLKAVSMNLFLIFAIAFLKADPVMQGLHQTQRSFNH